jgi:hypothetical protein
MIEKDVEKRYMRTGSQPNNQTTATRTTIPTTHQHLKPQQTPRTLKLLAHAMSQQGIDIKNQPILNTANQTTTHQHLATPPQHMQ